MKVELKNVKVNRAFSQETTCFQSTLYIDGVRVGTVENQGTGGPHTVSIPTNPELHKQLLAHALKTEAENVKADMLELGDLILRDEGAKEKLRNSSPDNHTCLDYLIDRLLSEKGG